MIISDKAFAWVDAGNFEELAKLVVDCVIGAIDFMQTSVTDKRIFGSVSKLLNDPACATHHIVETRARFSLFYPHHGRMLRVTEYHCRAKARRYTGYNDGSISRVRLGAGEELCHFRLRRR